MKKLMIIIAALMIGGAVSAHGLYGYHGGVIVRPCVRPYAYCAPRPVIIAPPVAYYHGGYGARYGGYHYYGGGCHGRYYR